jgi:GNAT superfamily N-acetyltransferase
MITAKYTDKSLVVDILSHSFDDNQSVNYIVKQDKKRARRIENLMKYSFDMCFYFGTVFLSDDRKACALILWPDKKKSNFRSILMEIKLIFFCISLSNIKRVIDREARIKKIKPQELMYYLWFLGVDPKEQNKGIGGGLMKDIVKKSIMDLRPIYLETSTLKNIPWYQKFGFKIYNQLDLGYQLFFMKKE